MFGVNFDWLFPSKFSKLFELYVHTHINETATRVKMRPCVPEDWILLGDNYQD